MSRAAAIAWRGVRAVPIGLAAFGIFAHGMLARGSSVWPGLLPIALLCGLAQQGTGRAAASPAGRTPWWLWLGALLALGVTLAALVHGALATPARHWDGFVAWELKATALTAAPTVRQPFFADHAVFSPSRDYPLLQPLLQAQLARLGGDAAGRLLFPSLWVVLVALAGLALRRAGHPSSHAWLAALGIGLMPMLVSPTSGAVDSGYAELALLLALTTIAAGMLLRDAWLLAAGCALAVLLKPEGVVYAGAVVACTWLSAPRALHGAAVVGTFLALVVWLPLLTFLQHGPDAAQRVTRGARLATVAALAVAAGLAFCTQPPAHGGKRARYLAVAAALLVAGAVAVACLAPTLGSGLDSYADNLRRLPARLERLPALALALSEQAISVKRFGLLFPLLACALLRRDRGPVSPAGKQLAFLLGAGLLVVVLSMLLSPEEDFDHHVRSSLDRLLLQWTGPCVLCIAVWLRPPTAETELDQPNAATIPSP